LLIAQAIIKVWFFQEKSIIIVDSGRKDYKKIVPPNVEVMKTPLPGAREAIESARERFK